MKLKEHYARFKMITFITFITFITYAGVFSNIFSSHYGFMKKFEQTPSLVTAGHYFKYSFVLLQFLFTRLNQ